MKHSVKGAHPVIRAIGSAVQRLAGTDMAVFICGERGTGKDLFARQLHALGRPADAPFVRIDCADAPYERLQFDLCEVGATAAAPPALQRSRNGTLLLDELAALPLSIQQDLAAQLAASDARPEPACRPARIVATGQHEAAVELQCERLSPELYTYLDPVEISLPALRQRRPDIPVLVEHFLQLYGERHGVGPCRVDTDAMVYLWQYDWPGNVRELESVIERVVVLSRGSVIRALDLPVHVCSAIGVKPSARPSAPRPLAGHHGVPHLRSTL